MKFRAFALALAVSSVAIAQGNGDTAFLAARDAYRLGQADKLEKAAAGLGRHELAPYVDNYRLRMALGKDDPSGIPDFLARHEGSYVAEKLRADWIRWLGKRARWAELEAEYARLIAPEPDITCYHLQARSTGSVPAESITYWLTLLEPPEPCRPVLDALVASGQLGVDDVWQRVRRQMEANRPNAARVTLDYLPAHQVPLAAAFESAARNAMAYLAKQPSQWAERRTDRELTALAIARVAANDPSVAVEQLERRAGKLQAGERQWAWSQIALQAARKHLAEAPAWFRKAGDAPLSDEGHQWKVRAALRAHDWGLVRDAIAAMPPALAEKPEWLYWLGRAYQAGGRTSEADALFGRLAGQPHFYGNLADEELGRPVMPPPVAPPPTGEEQKAARDNPGIRRALAFFRVDLRTEAVREWNWSLRGMSDRQLLAAAQLARQGEIWDRAINTADRTREEHDYTLRFLAPFSEQVRPAAREQALDDAWVYGLMRQESRFISHARSSAGAGGLMQLMPATAKWVARKIGLGNFQPHQVNDPHINVRLGTSYMRLVMENLDHHPVLASAAYNAGPGRAKRWRADIPLEGAIYAETIPFSETRDYVKKVMSNAVYYSALFNGQPDSLKTRLGTVAPRSNAPLKDSDLP